MLGKLMFSEHARIRMAQRKLSATDVEYIVDHGVRYHSAGCLFRFLGKRNISDKDKERLEGSVVLLDSDTETVVITVYRNRSEAAKEIRSKMKYRSKESYILKPNSLSDSDTAKGE